MSQPNQRDVVEVLGFFRPVSLVCDDLLHPDVLGLCTVVEAIYLDRSNIFMSVTERRVPP